MSAGIDTLLEKQADLEAEIVLAQARCEKHREAAAIDEAWIAQALREIGELAQARKQLRGAS